MGSTPSGRTVLVTVDGRSTEDLGLSIPEEADVARSLGLVDAINLDGGGLDDHGAGRAGDQQAVGPDGRAPGGRRAAGRAHPPLARQALSSRQRQNGCPAGSRKTRNVVPGWCSCLVAPSSSTAASADVEVVDDHVEVHLLRHVLAGPAGARVVVDLLEREALAVVGADVGPVVLEARPSSRAARRRTSPGRAGSGQSRTMLGKRAIAMPATVVTATDRPRRWCARGTGPCPVAATSVSSVDCFRRFSTDRRTGLDPSRNVVMCSRDSQRSRVAARPGVLGGIHEPDLRRRARRAGRVARRSRCATPCGPRASTRSATPRVVRRLAERRGRATTTSAA